MNLPLLIQITMIASLDEGLMSNTFFPNNSNRREICVCVCVQFCDKMLWFTAKWKLGCNNGTVLLDWRAKYMLGRRHSGMVNTRGSAGNPSCQSRPGPAPCPPQPRRTIDINQAI